jgi:polar amino acid transport system substrate-binding protein
MFTTRNNTIIIVSFLLILSILSCVEYFINEDIHVLVADDFYPFAYSCGADSLKGIEIELLKLIENKITNNIIIHRTSSPILLETLFNSDFDMAIGGVTITEIRSEYFNFSKPYYNATQSFVSKKSNNNIDYYLSLQPLKVGVVNNSSSQYYFEEEYIKRKNFNIANLKKFNTLNESISALKKDEINLILLENSMADIVSSLYELSVLQKIDFIEEYGIVFNKKKKQEKTINNALDKILTTNEWKLIKSKYLLEPFFR